MNKLIRPAKIALAKKYGYKNVSVKNGTGTAWGWVECRITTPKPSCNNHPAQFEYRSCECREKNHDITNEARQIMQKAWQAVGLKPYTYTADDGYYSEHSEVLVDVNYI